MIKKEREKECTEKKKKAHKMHGKELGKYLKRVDAALRSIA